MWIDFFPHPMDLSGIIWTCLVSCGLVWYNMSWSVVWPDLAWFDLVWFALVWPGLTWCGLVSTRVYVCRVLWHTAGRSEGSGDGGKWTGSLLDPPPSYPPPCRPLLWVWWRWEHFDGFGVWTDLCVCVCMWTRVEADMNYRGRQVVQRQTASTEAEETCGTEVTHQHTQGIMGKLDLLLSFTPPSPLPPTLMLPLSITISLSSI